MEIEFSDVISMAGLLASGGGIGFWFTWRYARRKEKAEAEQAETTAAKGVQDMYQELIEDMKNDRMDQRNYIGELKEDRDKLYAERKDLSERLDKMDEKVRQLQSKVEQNRRMVSTMRPMLCSDMTCKKRKEVQINTEWKIKENGDN